MDLTCHIVDGVRRAKASELMGRTSIQARIIEPETARLGPEVELALSDLLSPYKNEISLASVSEWQRWQAILDEVASDSHSPILVEVGSMGVRLSDVEIT